MSSKIRAAIAALSADTVSLEEVESSQAVEREVVFYAKLSNMEALRALSIRTEEQEQWELRSPLGNGRFRCRTTHAECSGAKSDSIVMCFKVNHDGGGHVETEQEVSQDVFDAFKVLAPNGMRKTRYIVPVMFGESQLRDLVWEVDVYADTEWVKIDLELDDAGWGIRCLPQSLLPSCFSETFAGTDTSKEDFRRELYEKYFLLKNPLSVDNREITFVPPAGVTFKSVPMGVTVNENMGGVSTEGFLDFLFKPKKKEKAAIEKAYDAFNNGLGKDELEKLNVVNTETVSNHGFGEIFNGNFKVNNLNDYVTRLLRYGEDCLNAEMALEKEAAKTVQLVMAKKDNLDEAEKVLLSELERLNVMAPPRVLYGKYKALTTFDGKPFLVMGETRHKKKPAIFYEPWSLKGVYEIEHEGKSTAKPIEEKKISPLTKEEITQFFKIGTTILNFVEKCRKAYEDDKYAVSRVYYEDCDEFDVLVWKIAENHHFSLDTDVFEGGNQGAYVVDGPSILNDHLAWLLVKMHRYVIASTK